jgi:hypothetical protein
MRGSGAVLVWNRSFRGRPLGVAILPDHEESGHEGIAPPAVAGLHMSLYRSWRCCDAFFVAETGPYVKDGTFRFGRAKP